MSVSQKGPGCCHVRSVWYPGIRSHHGPPVNQVYLRRQEGYCSAPAISSRMAHLSPPSFRGPGLRPYRGYFHDRHPSKPHQVSPNHDAVPGLRYPLLPFQYFPCYWPLVRTMVVFLSHLIKLLKNKSVLFLSLCVSIFVFLPSFHLSFYPAMGLWIKPWPWTCNINCSPLSWIQVLGFFVFVYLFVCFLTVSYCEV